MLRLTALLPLVLLAACRAEAPAVEPPPSPDAAPTAAEEAWSEAPATVPWDEARARGADFRAVGQEPAWLLEVYNDSLVVLEANYGADRIAVPTTAAPATGNGFSFDGRADGRALSVLVTETPCQDVMSGQSFPATVTVRIDGGRSFQGCGRALLD